MNARTLPVAWSAARRSPIAGRNATPRRSPASVPTRRPLDLLPLPDPRSAQGRTHDQCHRATLSRGPRVPFRWAPSRTTPPWTASCSPSSSTRTATRASRALRPDTNLLTLPLARATAAMRCSSRTPGAGSGLPPTASRHAVPCRLPARGVTSAMLARWRRRPGSGRSPRPLPADQRQSVCDGVGRGGLARLLCRPNCP